MKKKSDMKSEKAVKKVQLKKSIKRDWRLYVMLLPAILYIALFHYKPMYGILIAFQDFSIRKGVFGSKFVGLKNFERVFKSYWFPVIFKNTITISALGLLIGFWVPIILALILNELKNAKFRKLVQTISYAPHFISTVVMCGMITMFLDSNIGIISRVLMALGMDEVKILTNPGAFKWLMELSGIWQGAGWGSIIFFAALAGVDKALLEAAEIDGATRMQKIWHINIPEILPTIVMMFILRCGSILSVGYEKVYLLQNELNLTGSEVISTYTYKIGLEQADFSYSTAVGLFNTLVNAVFLIVANKLSKKITNAGLF